MGHQQDQYLKYLILTRQKTYKTNLAKKVRQEIRSSKKNCHKQITDKISEANPKSY